MPEESSSGDFTNRREVIVRTNLKPGYYVIIPATFFPDTETNFMIRVFSLQPFILKEIKNENDDEFSRKLPEVPENNNNNNNTG